jgi:hypothetical protein
MIFFVSRFEVNKNNAVLQVWMFIIKFSISIANTVQYKR